MNVDEILEEMEDLIDKSPSLPFISHKKLIDSERLGELINDMRLNMPQELKEAKKIEFDCQRILNEAKINAESIIRKAEERAKQLCSQEAIIAEAKKKAVDILQKAQASAANVQKQAALSVARMLNDAEAAHQRSLSTIKQTKEKLQHTLKNSPVLGANAKKYNPDMFDDDGNNSYR